MILGVRNGAPFGPSDTSYQGLHSVTPLEWQSFSVRPKLSRPRTLPVVPIFSILRTVRPISFQQPVLLTRLRFVFDKDVAMYRSTHRWIALLAFIVLGASGCCVHRTMGPQDPCGPPDSGLRPWKASQCESCGGGTFAEKASCRTGCGEIYWDEWLSDPPDCCDPCDDCGNWVGPQSCCRGGKLSGLWTSLWGCRGEPCRDGENCCQSECTACGGSSCSSCTDRGEDSSPFVDELDQRPPQPVVEDPVTPRPATKPDPKAKRPARPYHPSYTRPASYRR